MSTGALQLHYTSCRRGLRGGQGFQVRNASPGITPEEQREIEAAGLYTPPRDLPFDPSPDDIARLFPVMFRWQRLSTGRWVLVRSQYTGKDHSQRPGNFFAHTLVAQAPLLHWPIDFYEWPGWETSLNPEQDTAEGPPLEPLATVDLFDVTPAASFTLPELAVFLKEAPGRSAQLENIVRAAFQAKATSRRILVRDSALNGLFWLACVQKAFPLPHALALSASSYQFDARNLADLNLTTPGTDLTLDENQRRFQVFGFDFVSNAHSDVPEDYSEYAAAVCGWMARDPERLEAFHEFTQGITDSELGPRLLLPLRLFRLSVGEVADLPNAQLREALEHAAGHLPASSQGALLGVASQATKHAAATAEAEQLSTLLGFFAAAAPTATADEKSTVAAAWLSAFDTLGRHAQPSELAWSALARGRAAIAKGSEAVGRAIATELLAPARVQLVREWAADASALPAFGVARAIREVADASRVLGATEPVTAEPCLGLLQGLAGRALSEPRCALELLRAFGDSPRSVASICELWVASDSEPERARPVGAALSALLEAQPERHGEAIVAALDRSDTWPILAAALDALFERSREPAKLYALCRQQVLARAASFDAQHRSTVAERVLSLLAPPAATQQAIEWLESDQLPHFSPALRTHVLSLVARSIPLSNEAPETRTLAQLVERRAKTYSAEVAPDRAILRELLAVAAEPSPAVASLPLDRVQRALPELEEREYGQFLDEFLPGAFRGAAEKKLHREIVRVTFVDSFEHVFAPACARALASPRLANEALHASLRFWIGVPVTWISAREEALAALTDRVAALPRRDFEVLAARLDGAPWLPPEVPAWRALRDQVALRNRSTWSKLTEFFKGAKP